jgi:hypothetical protein
LGFTPLPLAHIVELQWHDIFELLWLLGLGHVFCAHQGAFAELLWLGGVGLGEQAGHGRRVGWLLRSRAPQEFLLRSWIRCYLRHQSEAGHAFCFVAHFGAVLGMVHGVVGRGKRGHKDLNLRPLDSQGMRLAVASPQEPCPK